MNILVTIYDKYKTPIANRLSKYANNSHFTYVSYAKGIPTSCTLPLLCIFNSSSIKSNFHS